MASFIIGALQRNAITKQILYEDAGAGNGRRQDRISPSFAFCISRV
jgi:hypothetical protein